MCSENLEEEKIKSLGPPRRLQKGACSGFWAEAADGLLCTAPRSHVTFSPTLRGPPRSPALEQSLRLPFCLCSLSEL